MGSENKFFLDFCDKNILNNGGPKKLSKIFSPGGRNDWWAQSAPQAESIFQYPRCYSIKEVTIY